MTILVTGCAGFIGMHVTQLLLARGDRVVGLDQLDDYYDPRLKRARLARLQDQAGFEFVQGDIAEREQIEALFARTSPERVVHLAAQVGVRNSIEHPRPYFRTNLLGFGELLEACRQQRVRHLVYASSSSVYGVRTQLPFSVRDRVDHPVSLYAASKKANELMAHAYSHLHGLPTTGLRYFTVYGPWGRPDMSPWLFTSAILEGRPIDVFDHGRMLRDFTYVDDIAEGTVRVLDRIPGGEAMRPADATDPGHGAAPYRIYNIGHRQPVELNAFIELIETLLQRKARRNPLPMQPGDVPATCADVEDLRREVGFEATTPLASGMRRFIDWYLMYRHSCR